jgi:hypothetical protein
VRLDQDRFGFFETLQLGEPIAAAAEEDAGQRFAVLSLPGVQVSAIV